MFFNYIFPSSPKANGHLESSISALTLLSKASPYLDLFWTISDFLWQSQINNLVHFDIDHQWLSYLVASSIIRSTNRQNQHLLFIDDYQDDTWLVFLCPPRSHCGRSHHLQTRKPWSITTLFHQIHIVDEKSGRWWRLTNNHINCNIFINLKLQWW